MCCCCSAIVYNVLARSLLLLVPLLFALVCGPSSICHRTTPMRLCACVCASECVLMFLYIYEHQSVVFVYKYIRSVESVSVCTVVDKRDFNLICVTSFGRWFYELCTAFSLSLFVAFSIPHIIWHSHHFSHSHSSDFFVSNRIFFSFLALCTICNACFDFSTLCVIVDRCVYICIALICFAYSPVAGLFVWFRFSARLTKKITRYKYAGWLRLCE